MIMEECKMMVTHYISGYSSVIDTFICHACVGDWESTLIKLWSCLVINKCDCSFHVTLLMKNVRLW